MTQPNLGKKIADLRKAKGLTQDELVEKCNISVRTLQRIESGEGSPRSYTLRIIFDALDYSQNDSNGISSNKIGSIISFRLEQFYRYFIDLFNLKTNTMKKITILSIMLSAIIFGLFTVITESKAQKEYNATAKVVEKTTDKAATNSPMVDGNFTCANCFYDNDDLIGYDVKFKQKGVSVKVQLIRLNTKSGRFNAGFITGILLENKVEISIKKDDLNKSIPFYSADNLEKFNDKIILKGNAKLISSRNEIIEANEIVFILN